MRIARISDCELLLDPWFLLLLGTAVLTGWVAEVVVLLGSLLTHELAHLLVGRGFGLEFRRIHLFPYGGVAQVDNLYAVQPAVVAVTVLAGPLNNLLLFGAAYALQQSGWLAAPLADFMLRVNLGIALFNLLPALPLDGGRLVHALCREREGDLPALRRLAVGGYGVAALLIAGAGVAAALGVPLPTVPVLAFFVAVGARRELLAAAAGHLRPLWQRPEEFARLRVLPAGTLVAAGDLTVRYLLPHLAGRRYHLVWVLGDDLRPRGQLSEADIVGAALDGRLNATLDDLLRGSR